MNHKFIRFKFKNLRQSIQVLKEVIDEEDTAFTLIQIAQVKSDLKELQKAVKELYKEEMASG